MIKNDNFKLTEEENKRKIDMLNKMKYELEQLEYQKEHHNRVNIEMYTLRLLRIVCHLIKKVSPYLLTASITFMIFKFMNFTPFIRDEITKKRRIEKTFDGEGNTKYEIQYEDFEYAHNRIELIGAWSKVNDNYYEREIKVYENNRITVDKIKELVKKQDFSLDSIFGEAVLVKKEKRNNLREEEINAKPYAQAVIYSKSNDEAMIIKESDGANLLSIVLWLFINIIIDEIFISSRRQDQETLESYIQEINFEYKIIDPEEIDRLIKIKKSNYERLTR